MSEPWEMRMVQKQQTSQQQEKGTSIHRNRMIRAAIYIMLKDLAK
jgi:hypothetical protein